MMVSLPPALPRPLVDDAVKAALLEDLGRAGDITTQATIPPGTAARLVIRGRKPGVIAGLPLAVSAFRQIDPDVRFHAHVQDGARIDAGTIVATVEGEARSMLSAERVALNFLGRLSGVATATRRFADAIAHTPARITCTRKTTPGLRAFEKYAVKLGGGSNHRFGLDDAILIKDNHVAVAGGVKPAIERARAFSGHLVRVEVEVDTLDQLREALEAGPDVVLLDNMAPGTLREAVAITARRAITEASGTIALDTIAAVAETGVDYISSGWITHSSPVLDLGLDVDMG
ncbi:carboxylating nicotinate-nucleotide diphosphorylase [Chthonobacter rhizosphaerae]|uniref:carboxylating nicotinate-nucleotide diphosphorylase n=1 Tax=Chthonobacter rhizosphaerae TaxID=2735553 RepID=UPI001FE6EFCB|nr:carboxylating nicotinate-nucleotide diphosphorylase [Chthonobacter rhizosphaerae]